VGRAERSTGGGPITPANFACQLFHDHTHPTIQDSQAANFKRNATTAQATMWTAPQRRDDDLTRLRDTIYESRSTSR